LFLTRPITIDYVNCTNCGQPVLPHERHCVRCQADCGFPNVRAAQQPAEKNALAARVKSAEDDAKSRGTEPVLGSFRDAVLRSRAVRVREFAEVYGLIKGDNKLLGTFYDLKGAGLLRPAATEMEASRQSAEPLVFLNYQNKIQFAALALSDDALFAYGDCAMVFQDSAIAHRATVFEENCVFFCERHSRGPGRTALPPGSRATWDQRHQLAAAKLASQLHPETKEADFPGILLHTDAKNTRNDDFIEVHIYDRLHRSALDYVVVRSKRASKGQIKEMQAVLGAGKVKVL
jgi:hypothetical protein